MLNYFLKGFDWANELFFASIAWALISALGICLSIQSGFFQIRGIPKIVGVLFQNIGRETSVSSKLKGVHPIRTFFAATGGMIGIGNVAAAAVAVQVGGPGALLWLWAAALLGSVVKYSEVYLGHKYREGNSQGGYDGGPMYFLKKAFSAKSVPIWVGLFLCIYGIEVYQFLVIVDELSLSWQLQRSWVIFGLLGAVIYASVGGIKRVGMVCSLLLPVFTLVYLGMTFWVITQHWFMLPQILGEILSSAFRGHAPVGGFVGSTLLLSLQQGFARAAYSADIGVGFDSVIHSESRVQKSYEQARFSIIGVFLDNLICTCSILVVLCTGVWKSTQSIPGSRLVHVGLSQHLPYLDLFMPIFLFVLGYSTIIAYFSVGLKCAKFIHPRLGKPVYLFLGAISFISFSYQDQSVALTVMATAQSFLILLNLLGVYRLRKEIEFR